MNSPKEIQIDIDRIEKLVHATYNLLALEISEIMLHQITQPDRFEQLMVPIIKHAFGVYEETEDETPHISSDLMKTFRAFTPITHFARTIDEEIAIDFVCDELEMAGLDVPGFPYMKQKAKEIICDAGDKIADYLAEKVLFLDTVKIDVDDISETVEPIVNEARLLLRYWFAENQ